MKVWRGAQVLVVGLAVTLFIAACGSSGKGSSGSGVAAKAVNCPGQPVKIMVAENLTGPSQQYPEAVEGAQAAAQAVNTTCELGRPLKIVTCDDMLSPNTAATCAREAVSDHVIAVAGMSSGLGDTYVPILAKAKIPDVGNVASSLDENTSPYSFPTVASLAIALGQISAAADAGATKVQLVSLDLPAVSFIISEAKAEAAKLGIKITGETLVPVTATDVTQYAAQIVSSKADGVAFILDDVHVLQVLKALKQEGLDPNKVKLITGSVAIRPTEVAANAASTEGIYVAGPAWPSTDPTNSGIKQYLSELKVIGAKSPASDIGVNAWSTVHIIADLVKGAPTIDAATLVTKLTAAGPINRPELGAVDWSKPAFPQDPVLSKFRVFDRTESISRVINGKVTPVSNGFVDVATKATLNKS